MDKFSPTTSLK